MRNGLVWHELAQNFRNGDACRRHFLRGLSSLNLASVSQSIAFALALDVKIDAAPFQKFDPLSQTRYFVQQMGTP